MTKAWPIIVSGADSGYFELLQGRIRSVRDKPEGTAITLGVLDVGLGEADCSGLGPQSHPLLGRAVRLAHQTPCGGTI